MTNDEFPKINRGNGVANDNLATLGDIMLATLKKVRDIDTKVDANTKEIVGVTNSVDEVKKTIEAIDKTNAPTTKRSFWLLVTSVGIGVVGLVLAYLALHR